MHNIPIGTLLKGRGASSDATLVDKTDLLFAVFYDDKKIVRLHTAEMLEEYFELLVEKWVPELYCRYWYVTQLGDVDSHAYNGDDKDEEHIAFNNCFRTKVEARIALEKIRNVLK